MPWLSLGDGSPVGGSGLFGLLNDATPAHTGLSGLLSDGSPAHTGLSGLLSDGSPGASTNLSNLLGDDGEGQ